MSSDEETDCAQLTGRDLINHHVDCSMEDDSDSTTLNDAPQDDRRDKVLVTQKSCFKAANKKYDVSEESSEEEDINDIDGSNNIHSKR